MKVSPISFGKVYALYGSKQQVMNTCRGICDDLANKNPSITIHNATEIYKNNRGNGILTQAAHEGKDVCFIITGKEDCKKASFMYPGWGSLNGISQHIYKGFDLNKINECDIKEIKESALDITESKSCQMPCGEGVFNTAYNEMIESGMNPDDAYMKAIAIEDEILEYPIRHE